MSQLAHTFRLLELTRSQVQYGYALSGISKHEISDLAQHHYLVASFAWQLARAINKQGGTLNIERILEITLVHDLGELFGGDIAMPYAKANTAAREKATAFEQENQRYLSTILSEDPEYLQSLFAEANKPVTDEALVAKIADYMEVTHYKIHIRRFSPGDVTMIMKRINTFIDSISAPTTKAAARSLITLWSDEIQTLDDELFASYK
jgi:5'-deoxynucleotidase YfbR-like HD superfamily hydrolase